MKRINLEVNIIKEPDLEFAYSQKLKNPHDGLTLFGPVDLNSSSHPQKIKYGLIGTKEGVDLFLDWAKLINRPILPLNIASERLWPMFPGFAAVFHTEFPEKPVWTKIINKGELIDAASNNDPYIRASNVVEKYVSEIGLAQEKRDEATDIVMCIVPDIIYKNCRPKSSVINGEGYRPTPKVIEAFRSGQQRLFQENASKIYNFSPDFRRQLKARAMQYDLPIQIVKEATLYSGPDKNKSRGLTPLSDRAWNMSTTIYYKAGGKPWKLSSAREGVCYIGIAFKRNDQKKIDRTATCAAQMFLDSGDGVVFLGDPGPWYSPEKKECHLSKPAAKALLENVLKTYADREGKELKEIFIHSRSELNKEEIEGYAEACPENVKLVIIRVKIERNGVKLFREGNFPVLRGTFLKQDDKTSLLWGSGFKPNLGTYDGWEIPVPLRIRIQYGDATIEQVSNDIFSLTKLNYNACRLGDSEPVTIKFSDAVGEILVYNPAVKDIRYKFRFYI